MRYSVVRGTSVAGAAPFAGRELRLEVTNSEKRIGPRAARGSERSYAVAALVVEFPHAVVVLAGLREAVARRLGPKVAKPDMSYHLLCAMGCLSSSQHFIRSH